MLVSSHNKSLSPNAPSLTLVRKCDSPSRRVPVPAELTSPRLPQDLGGSRYNV